MGYQRGGKGKCILFYNQAVLKVEDRVIEKIMNYYELPGEY